jgi:hypothetical protein
MTPECQSLALEGKSPAMNLESLAVETRIRGNGAKSPHFNTFYVHVRLKLAARPPKERLFMGTDWYPNSRDAQLHTVKTWNTVFATKGQAWGIPQGPTVYTQAHFFLKCENRGT